MSEQRKGKNSSTETWAGGKTKPAQKNAVKNNGSTAGKCQGQGVRKTAQTAPSKTPAKGSGLFKFRRYKKAEGGKKKARHPKLIVEQEQSTVGFMGLTEAEKSGHHKNIKLKENPKKGDKRPAYIRKEIKYDTLDNFGEILENYHLSDEDKRAVLEYIKKRKKKK